MIDYLGILIKKYGGILIAGIAGTLKYLGKTLYNIINKLDLGHFNNLKY